MPRNPVWIRPAFLATREKLEDRFIYVGKIAKEGDPFVFMFYLIEILSPWHPSTKVEEVITKALSHEYSQKGTFKLEDFEETLKVVNEKLGVLSQDGDNDWIGNLNSIVGLVEKGNLHISVCGNILGYLIRKGKISSITEGLSVSEEHPLKTFVNITSGAIAEDDRVIIGNINFFDLFSIDRLKKLTTGTHAKESLFEIHRALRRSKVKETSAILLDCVPEEYKETEKEKELSEMLFLDQGIETGFSKFVKKSAPVAKDGAKTIGKGLSSLFNYSKVGASKAHTKWKEKYAPKTKELFKKGASGAGAGISRISNRLKENSQVKYMGVKVKPYSKKPSGSGSKIFEAIINAFSKAFAKENRRYLYIVLVIIVVLVGYMKIRANNANRTAINQEKEISQSYTQAVDLFNKAKEDLALNKSNAKDELSAALDLAIKAQGSASTKDNAVKLANDIEDKLDGLIGATRVRNPEVLYSVKGNVLKSALVGTLVYSITDEGKIYLTDTKDKTPKLVASIASDSGQVLSTAYSDSASILYMYTDKNLVLALDTNSNSIGKSSLDSGATWEESKAIGTYVSNIYLLDSKQGKIWKHSFSNNIFGKGTSYTTAKDVDLKNSLDITIDGNIFVLKADGGIAKFVRGAYDSTFSTKGLPTPYDKITQPTALFTDSDTNFLYVLDKGNNRIIRFDKTGTFSNQYFFDGITVDQFFVNPRVQKMWVTAGSNVYEIAIK